MSAAFTKSGSLPDVQRWIALGLIVVQAVTFGYLTSTWLFPVLIGVAALIPAATRWRVVMDRQTHFRLVLVLTVLFLVKHAVFPIPIRMMSQVIRTALAFAVGQFATTVQTIDLYAAYERDRLPLRLPVLGAFAMICFGDIQVSLTDRHVFQALSILLALGAASYYGRRREYVNGGVRRIRWGRGIIGVIVLVVAAGSSWLVASSLYRYERNIDQWIARLYAPGDGSSAVGFSGNARLGSLMERKTNAEAAVALRVTADWSPDYLRGKAFMTFSYSQWSVGFDNPTISHPVRPPSNMMRVPPPNHLLAVRHPPTTRHWSRMECWPDTSLAGRFFTPLKTTHVATAEEDVVVDDNDVFRCEGQLPGHPYMAYVADDPVHYALSTEQKRQLTRLPSHLDPRINELARIVFANCRTTAEKAAAVVRYFHANYDYHLGIQIPPGEDPLTFFLLNRPAAHCEYFASGAAVLLRLAGVPCRYVTGFVVTERDRFSDQWIARNRDAHAWVEAYDDSAGWFIVEATPASGIPTETRTAAAKQLWEYLCSRFQRFRVHLQQRGLRGLIGVLAGWLIGIPGMILLALGGLWLTVRRLRRRKWTREPRDPLLLALQRLLKRMDARLHQQGLDRWPHETLHQFADRIQLTLPATESTRCLADWYRRYAAIRYGDRVTVDAIDTIRHAIREELAI